MKKSSFCGCDDCGCVGVAKLNDIVYMTNTTLPAPRPYIPFEKALWDDIVFKLKGENVFYEIIKDMKRNLNTYKKISSFIEFIFIDDVDFEGVHSRKLTYLNKEIHFSHDELELFILGVADNEFDFENLPEVCSKQFKLKAA